MVIDHIIFVSIAVPKYSIRAAHEATTMPVTQKRWNEDQSSQNWKIKMLYDGDSPLCMSEVCREIFYIFVYIFCVMCVHVSFYIRGFILGGVIIHLYLHLYKYYYCRSTCLERGINNIWSNQVCWYKFRGILSNGESRTGLSDCMFD